MKFSVCIKQVPDVASKTRLEDGRIVHDNERMVLNAYDASAVEEALVLREEHEDIEIEVVLAGPDSAAETIRKALAMGADSGTHVVVDHEPGFDSRAYATILAAYFTDRMPDVILCGKQSQDTDSGLTGSMLAALLDIPYTTNAVGLELESETFVVTRQGDAGREMMALPFPSLATCSNDMNDPRIPSLKGIMQSKKKTIERIELEDLSVAEQLGAADKKRLKVKGFKTPPDRPEGKMFEGSAREMVAQLMAEL